ncbi:MAG TPA: hypothetical protein PKL83_01565 [bacterium]|nr:hypothetical protein [bacterium]
MTHHLYQRYQKLLGLQTRLRELASPVGTSKRTPAIKVQGETVIPSTTHETVTQRTGPEFVRAVKECYAEYLALQREIDPEASTQNGFTIEDEDFARAMLGQLLEQVDNEITRMDAEAQEAGPGNTQL